MSLAGGFALAVDLNSNILSKRDIGLLIPVLLILAHILWRFAISPDWRFTIGVTLFAVSILAPVAFYKSYATWIVSIFYGICLANGLLETMVDGYDWRTSSSFFIVWGYLSIVLWYRKLRTSNRTANYKPNESL